MALIRTIKLASGSLLEHPLRTLLTMLGIIIGVAAVFSMLSIGEASRAKILENLDSIDARTIRVFPDWTRGRASQRRPYRPFSETDITELRAIPGVWAATGDLSSNYPIVSSTNDWSAEVQGADEDYLRVNELTIDLGRMFGPAEIERSDLVAVLGPSVVRSLFAGQNPVGERVKIRNIPFLVIGTGSETQSDNWRGQDPNNYVIIPRSTLRNRLVGDNRRVRSQVQGVRIVGETQGSLKRIEDEANFILRRSRGLSPSDAPDFRVLNFSANRQAAADSQRILSLLLLVMGIVSLAVSSVGVMNIMLVSVTERTREIGLRMALGARRSSILGLFLTEAILLSVAAGLLGLALGYGVSLFFQKQGGDIEMAFSPAIALISFGSAVIVGLLSGILPARSASNLDPIEALRHE